MSRINEEQWGEFLAELNARNAAVQPPATPQEPICGTCGKPASDGDTYVQCGPCHWASTPSPEGQTTWHDRGVQLPATPQEPDNQVTPMTPTAQIAAIRQKRWLDRDGDDVNTLLALWDTHQSALRGLVAQWRAAAADELNDYAVGYDCCADHLERLLESEQ